MTVTTLEAPTWFPMLESGGLPPEPPIEVSEWWRPDDDWWLMIAIGLQVAIVAFCLITDYMELRGKIEGKNL